MKKLPKLKKLFVDYYYYNFYSSRNTLCIDLMRVQINKVPMWATTLNAENSWQIKNLRDVTGVFSDIKNSTDCTAIKFRKHRPHRPVCKKKQR